MMKNKRKSRDVKKSKDEGEKRGVRKSRGEGKRAGQIYFAAIFLLLAALPVQIPAWQTSERIQIVEIAKKHIGVPYRRGGSSPAGFDCSGFTSYVYRQVGLRLPRTSREQYRQLNPVKKPQKGDLLFFRTNNRSVSHVGIYIGNFTFIHAPNNGKSVRIDDMRNPYWRRVYVGSRSHLL